MTLCPVCGCPVQRTIKGTLEQGLASHYRTCHPDREPRDAQRPGDWSVRAHD